MKLLQKINKLFEQLSKDIEGLWTDFAKDKEMTGKPVQTYHQLNPQNTYDVWFPLKTQQYRAKIRSRSPRSALLRLLFSYNTISYKGHTYSPDTYKRLFQILVNNGDFSFNVANLTEAKEISPFNFQDSNQEKIIHSDWNAASPRFDLEGAGDIFRELCGTYQDPGYIGEKVRRLENLFQGYDQHKLHPDDTIENALKLDKDKMDKLAQLWEAQPYTTPEQNIAREMNLALVKGNIPEAKRLLGKIKNLKRTPDFKLKLNEEKMSKEEQHFEDRTRKHIELVQQAAKQIAEAFPETFGKLSEEVKDHDASKLKEPERTPYISITWRHKLEQENDEFDPIHKKGYQPPGLLKKEDENKATLHHITTNSHHPEYWLADKSEANINTKDRDKSDHIVDATKMPPMAIAEMVADWQAMAEELKKNTAREWYDTQKEKRWHFSKEQDQLIDELLKIFEKKSPLNEATISDWQQYINRSPMLKAAIQVLNTLNTKGQAYIVGGAVRDIITGEKQPDDIDIATNVPMEEVAKMFETYDLGKSKTFGVLGIKNLGHTFEVAQFRSDGAYLDGRRPEKVQVGVDFKTDVERRDFTINAMGIDAQGNIIDYFNGQGDIKNKVLRTVGDPHKRFGEDYLRMLRAARFASRMGYEIDPETKKAMSTHAEKIQQIAPERIMKEIVKMAEQTGERFASALQILKETGLLQYILPEVIEMDKYEHVPETHPEGNVLEHTLEALKQNKLKDPITNLAILLHDIGKIKTFKKEGDKISYINHAEEGVDLINQIADRLRMDNKTREALIYACVNHMKFHDIVDMSTNKIVNLMSNDNWEVLKNVAYADSAARQGIFDQEEWNKIVNKIETITKQYEGQKALANIRKVVDGKWVMELRKLETGPEVGRIINATVDWILNNKIDLNDTEAIKQYILNI